MADVILNSSKKFLPDYHCLFTIIKMRSGNITQSNFNMVT